jgi:CBS domain-containing protein
MRVKDLMTALTVRCTPHTTLCEAANLMLEHHCACLPVEQDLAEGGEIIGMISERDLVCRVVAEGLDPVMSTVWLAMTMPANTVHEDATLDECSLRFRQLQSDHLVVVDQHYHPCGIITQGDLARPRTALPQETWSSQRSASVDRTYSGRLVTARSASNRLRAVCVTDSVAPYNYGED